jgi:hypothetical protein
MAWTTPPTETAGQPLAAADLNIVRDDLIDLDARTTAQSFTGVKLSKVGAVSIVTATPTDVIWDFESFDVGTWWTSGADITVPAGTVPSGFSSAVLHVDASCRFAVNGTGVRNLYVSVNGVQATSADQQTADASETVNLTQGENIVVVDGDVIRGVVVQSSGGALNVDRCYIDILRVGIIV